MIVVFAYLVYNIITYDIIIFSRSWLWNERKLVEKSTQQTPFYASKGLTLFPFTFPLTSIPLLLLYFFSNNLSYPLMMIALILLFFVFSFK